MLGVLLYVCLAVSWVGVQAYKAIADVPEVLTDETNQPYVSTAVGARWHLKMAEEYGRVYFANLVNGQSIWEDPRLLPLTENDKANLAPESLAALESNHSKLAQIVSGGVPSTRSSQMATLVAASIPVVGLAIAVIARIWYLHTYNPEALFPTKERKQRRQKQQKFKQQKARGKMSQDGKGGRSANS